MSRPAPASGRSFAWRLALGCALALAAPAFAAPAHAAPPPPSGPLHIAADNVTGSHEPTGDVVLLNGNVRITRGRTVITAQQGRYQRALGLLDLDGAVRMVDSTTTVTCDHVTYSEQDDILQLVGHVVVRDRNGELQAPSGTYDRRAGRADLSGPVQGRDADRALTLVSDRALYWRDSLTVQALGNVHGVDDQHKTTLDARRIDYDRARKVALATGQPVLRATDDDGRVAELHAVRMRVDTQARIAEALDSVRIVRDTLQASGRYGRFDDVAQRGILVGSPRVWDDQTVVTGDTLEIFTRQRVLQRAVMRPRAAVDYAGNRPGTVGESSHLTGDRVDVYFTHEDIDSLVATGDARDTYTSPAQKGKTAERNETTGDTITVFFQQRKIDRAEVRGSAQGEYRLAVTPGDTVAARREQVKYDARRIEFQVQHDVIDLDGDAHLLYSDLELHARQVTYDVHQQTLVAQGKPVLNDRGDEVTGGLMTYDLESRVGTIYEAQTTYEKGLYHGGTIRKAGENELDVLNGSYSTCDLPEPHYHFAAHWMKIYLKDKLVAKPVVFYIKHVPILALPFWVFPIKPGRHSGFLFPQFELGFSNRAGQFFRNAGYYWAPNDYMDLTASGDYYQAEPSWVVRGEGNYKLLYVLDGNFVGSYAKDENPAAKRVDWDFNANHAQELSPTTRLTGQAQFVSSKEYSTSAFFGRTLADRVNRFLVSSLALSRAGDWASVSAVVDRRQDLDADQSLTGAFPAPPIGTLASTPNLTESTPSVSVSLPTRTLGSLGFVKSTGLGKRLNSVYFGLSGSFLQYTQHQGFVRDTLNDTTALIGQHVTTRRGASTAASLSSTQRLFGWLNFQPSFSSNAVLFDFDELGHKLVPAATWSSALTMGTSFYGTFAPHVFGLAGLRHVVSPSVSVTYSPEFGGLLFHDSTGVERNRFNGFGSIAISGARTENVAFSLDQRLQVKLNRNGQVQRLDNLLSWTISGNYNFLWREFHQLHALSPLASSVFLQPPGVVNASLTWITDPYQGRPVRNLTANVGLNLTHGGTRKGPAPELPIDQASLGEPRFDEDWSLGLAYSYAGGYTTGPLWSAAQTANAVGRWQFSPAWGLEYSSSLDITHHNLTTQRFGVTRDLHCWEASFTRTFVLGGEAEYYFRLSVKDQREIYFERGTRVGSIGGLQ